MYELKVTVTKVLGTCTAAPDMKPGDSFTVSDGNIRLPEGGYICLYALQNLIPLLPVKEREILEEKDDDWMWRVHHAQCPDPDGRVIFKIERRGTTGEAEAGEEDGPEFRKPVEAVTGGSEDPGMTAETSAGSVLKDLTVTVESVNGKCTSPMESGDSLELRNGRLYIPPGGHFCLYALQSLLPLLPAKQRLIQEGDWMMNDHHVICPDPAGNVIMRIDRKE